MYCAFWYEKDCKAKLYNWIPTSHVFKFRWYSIHETTYEMGLSIILIDLWRSSNAPRWRYFASAKALLTRTPPVLSHDGVFFLRSKCWPLGAKGDSWNNMISKYGAQPGTCHWGTVIVLGYVSRVCFAKVVEQPSPLATWKKKNCIHLMYNSSYYIPVDNESLEAHW